MNLTLYSIETTLLQLMQTREEVLAEPDSPERTTSLSAIDNEIKVYLEREVQKVDGVAGYLRECDRRADTLDDEADRIADKADLWRQRRSRLEKMVIDIMQRSEKTRLEGADSTLSLRQCPPSVEVSQLYLLPAEFRRLSVTLTVAQWSEICAHLPNELRETIALEALANPNDTEPIKSLIKDELKKPGGAVPGCRLITDKVKLKVE